MDQKQLLFSQMLGKMRSGEALLSKHYFKKQVTPGIPKSLCLSSPTLISLFPSFYSVCSIRVPVVSQVCRCTECV